MSDVMWVPVEGGEPFLIEVDQRWQRVGRVDERIDMAGETFQRSLARVQAIAGHVFDTVSSLPRSPDRVRVEFGVKLTAEANVILTRTTGDAHFVLDLVWEKKSAEAGAEDEL